MDGIGSIIARFPQRELEIWQRYIRDEQFRNICSDFEEMTAALHQFFEGDPRIEEYKNFLGELEAEVLTHLDRPILD